MCVRARANACSTYIPKKYYKPTVTFDKIMQPGYALKSAVPSIPLTKLSAGFADSCGISAGDLSIACWGAKSTDDLKPPEGRFSDVSVGTRSACALSAGTAQAGKKAHTKSTGAALGCASYASSLLRS